MVYRVKKFSKLEQKEFGFGRFLKKNIMSSIRPKYLWRRLKYGLVGGLVGGGIGGFIGSTLAGMKNYKDESNRADALGESYFSDNREDASPELIEKAKTEGVVQKVGDSWRIVAIKKGKLWNAHYQSKEKAEKALSAYHANKH